MDYCLDIKNNIYKLGDLNLFMMNRTKYAYHEIDPMDPEKPFFTGTFSFTVDTDGGTRPFTVYIPERFPISGAGLFLLADNGTTGLELLKHEYWKELAEQYQISLIVLEADQNGWSRKNIQREVKYCEDVFKKAISRTHFSMNEATYYLMGIGEGAYPAAVYGILNSTVFSALLLDGDTELHPDLVTHLGRIRSDRDPLKSKLQVAMPAWIAGDGELLRDILMRASGCEDRGLRNSYARVYQQNIRIWQNNPDGLPLPEIWFSSMNQRNATSSQELHAEMIRFAMGFKRWLAIGNGDFRPARTWEDMGLLRKTEVIDGRLRQWHIYEPSAFKKNPDERRPLVVAIHGYSCTGPIFAENSEWHNVAERRDFFLVYVSAFPSNLNQDGCTVPLPTWNTKQMISEMDDVSYIQRVLEDMKQNYPIDTERIYVSGHSNGSLMTQRLMEEMPEVFAAFGPTGAQYHMGTAPGIDLTNESIPDDGIIRPVWLMMGHEDIGGGDDLSEGSNSDRFISMMCSVNHLDRRNVSCLKNGKYTTYTFYDHEKQPLLKFSGVEDMPHAYTPEIARMYYDEYLCHFRRKKDGAIEYIL